MSGQHHCVGEYEIKDLSLQRPQRLCHHKGWGLHVRKGHRGCWHSRSKKRKTSVRLSSLQDRNGVGTPPRLIFTGESGPPATLVRWRARGLNRHRFAGRAPARGFRGPFRSQRASRFQSPTSISRFGRTTHSDTVADSPAESGCHPAKALLLEHWAPNSGQIWPRSHRRQTRTWHRQRAHRNAQTTS